MQVLNECLLRVSQHGSTLTMISDIILYEKPNIKSKARHSTCVCIYTPKRHIPVSTMGMLQMGLGLVSIQYNNFLLAAVSQTSLG